VDPTPRRESTSSQLVDMGRHALYDGRSEDRAANLDALWLPKTRSIEAIDCRERVEEAARLSSASEVAARLLGGFDQMLGPAICRRR
jgi:hypothetical protein